jgi:hypothetical protein
MLPPPLKPDSEANFQALNAQLGDSCAAPILEPERSALLQEALADSQLQAVKAQLESRGLGMNADEAQAVRLVGGEQLVIPFGQDAHLVWTRTNGQTAAIGLVRQGNKTLNVGADGQERVVRFLSAQQAEKLLRKLREKGKFQDFEGKLAQKGKRVGKVRVLLDETNKIAILGIAAEGDEKIGHQVRIKVKANKDDEPEDDSEPAIQATACGQATGEAVPTGTRMQPLALPSGGGDFEGGYEGPQICTSQWGYDYLCLSRTPMLSLSLTGTPPTLALPQTFINQQVQASFTIWNGGGGTLTGTVSAPAPFSIVSGASFSLLPGQPQEVVVRFSSGTAGSFSKSVSISSNGGSATVTATGVAHKVSFSPAPLDFGSGLLVMREQCNKMGTCGLGTEKVGLPIEKQLTVKNEGTVAVSLTLSTAAPYKIVSVPPTLSPGQSAQVTLRFDPTESGSFSGNVQVGINGGQGSVTAPLVGTAHKIEVSPPQIGFGLLLLSDSSEPTYKEQQLTVKNQGVTTVSVTASVSEPFRITTGNSFALAPAASSEVTVRFDPPAPGEFQGAVKLTVGQLTIEIPAKASAMNEQDFLQMLAELSQIRELDTVIPGRHMDIALLGAENLTATDLQALLRLTENQDWGSMIPDQTGNWLLDLFISYLISATLELFFRTPQFDIGLVIADLKTLAEINPEHFHSNYRAWVTDPDPEHHNAFKAFVGAVISALNRASQGQDPRQVARLWAAFGATSIDEAVEKIIQTVVDTYREADATTRSDMITIINWFGPAGVYFLATMRIIDRLTNSGIFSLTVSSLISIVNYLSDFPWFYRGSNLWNQIAQAIVALGNAVASDDPTIIKQSNQILIALVFTASMANSGGWQIYGFRVRLYNLLDSTVADVVASITLSTGRQVLIFAQFFHAFEEAGGYNSQELDKLIRWVTYYAQAELGNRITMLKSYFGPEVPAGELATRYKPGIVIAVSKADTNGNGYPDSDDAALKLQQGVDRCSGCFFGVVIEIDPDKEEVTRISGVGISDEEAKEIAARMGITVGSKWSLEQLIMYLMGMFMK